MMQYLNKVLEYYHALSHDYAAHNTVIIYIKKMLRPTMMPKLTVISAY